MPIDAQQGAADPHALLARYLDFFREVTLAKLDGLPEHELRSSRLPSGWTPLELLNHLGYVERRWLCWGFLGEQVPDPWGDRGPDDRWRVPADEPVAAVRERYEAQCERSRAIVAAEPDLDRRAAVGGRFATAAEAPTLGQILFHLVQEYARHAGHLDIVRELADGAVED
ncbi:DinB family protein [Streptomyces boninensis]|uniref:DinB family protein n=1 Tax=Streptomyces boninensis TaxID=2039455 RepID=UPI003B223559